MIPKERYLTPILHVSLVAFKNCRGERKTPLEASGDATKAACAA